MWVGGGVNVSFFGGEQRNVRSSQNINIPAYRFSRTTVQNFVVGEVHLVVGSRLFYVF